MSVPLTPTRAEPWHVSTLKTKAGLRQAWLLKEILDPPMALRRPQNGGNEL
jgi:hypothetical protein